jgi:hypothetical protein
VVVVVETSQLVSVFDDTIIAGKFRAYLSPDEPDPQPGTVPDGNGKVGKTNGGKTNGGKVAEAAGAAGPRLRPASGRQDLGSRNLTARARPTRRIDDNTAGQHPCSI